VETAGWRIRRAGVTRWQIIAHYLRLDIIGLSLETKLVGAYILTCPHGNMIGCFRLPIAYVVDDLTMSCQTVSEGFRNLCDKGLIAYDSTLSWLLIRKFLKWNPIDNPNQGKAAAKQVDAVPRNSSVYAPLVQILAANPSNFPEGFLNRLETVGEAYRTPQPQPQPQPQLQPHPEPEPHPETKDLSSSVEKPVKAKASVRFTADEIQMIYQAYPKKVGKAEAHKAIENALIKSKEADPLQYLLEATRAFAKSPAGNKGQFTPYPATWFNGRHYEDDRAEWQEKDGGDNRRASRAQNFDSINYTADAGLAPGQNVGRF
jgi:hypothetical protein